MRPRPTQFGMRENTVSPRQHASRFTAAIRSNVALLAEGDLQTQQTSHRNARLVKVSDSPVQAPPPDADIGRDAIEERNLLKVHEVAELLQVPVSWVYGRMRKRSLERLPGYRLGKYWRFRKGEILAWVERHCGGSHAS